MRRAGSSSRSSRRRSLAEESSTNPSDCRPDDSLADFWHDCCVGHPESHERTSSMTLHPIRVAVSQINSGDTAWMISATALVLMMTIPGLALFYAGMVRKKNIIATMAQTLAVCALVSVLWCVVGYSLAFMPGTPLVGDN